MPDKLPTPVNIGTSFRRRQLATPTDIIDVAEKSSTSNSVRACFWNSSYFSRTWKLPRSSFSKPQSRDRRLSGSSKRTSGPMLSAS